MVTWRMVDTVPIIEMNTTRSFKLPSSKSCGFRLLDNNVLESTSSVGQNSVYKSKIDLMFDSTRSSLRNRFNDTRGSHRTRSIIMYGRSELASAEESFKSISNLLQESKETTKRLTKDTKNNVKRVSNSVQEQIEQLFTDVAKDATSSFAVIYLGSLPLKDKITSLQGLQEPLRELYLKELNTKCSGFLEICATGLRVKLSSNYGKETNDENITPFHNIAVWSAVKFIQSRNNGGAAFLPLMTDPENIDKTSLFRPLCSPLGFSELFNEFRLHENLHSLDEILYAIIDADGMSFNDLKPIYKEFLLKLAVTLTKDELFQRSKNIMRRQRKKKLKVRSSTLVPQKKLKPSIFGTKSLKKVFQLDQFRSCRGKLLKLEQKNKYEARKRDSMEIMGNQNFAPGHQSGEQHARPATSGSEASIVRKDNTIHGFHRHSSSGYVSCSGCSYDSGSCTCTSADRCYCSLRTYHVNNRLLRNYEDNLVLSKSSTNINRDSLISCKSDDKCYCSMVEEVNENVGGDFGNNQSDTTWCDTDSCISTSKCYCKHVNGGKKSECVENNTSISCQGNSSIRTTGENLALDYELFTISDNGKSVQPHEALSVKKSVEAAAIFADVKLNQTTDIKSMFPSNLAISKIPIEDWSNADGSKQKKALKELDTSSMDRRHNKNQDFILSANSTHISHSADDLLCKLEVLQTNSESESIKSASNKFRTTLSEAENRQSFRNNKLINASLEDTLGYLP